VGTWGSVAMVCAVGTGLTSTPEEGYYAGKDPFPAQRETCRRTDRQGRYVRLGCDARQYKRRDRPEDARNGCTGACLTTGALPLGFKPIASSSNTNSAPQQKKGYIGPKCRKLTDNQPIVFRRETKHPSIRSKNFIGSNQKGLSRNGFARRR